MSKPTKQGRPKKFDDREDLPTATSGYYVKRAKPSVVDSVTSWIDGTDANYQYIGIGNPKERVAEHERRGNYDPDRDHVEVIEMKEDATYDELRAWEKEKIAQHNPVKNQTTGGEGRTPDEFRSGHFEGDMAAKERIQGSDYDDSDDSDDSDEGECSHCWNLAALACPNACCANCCPGCDRHGW